SLKSRLAGVLPSLRSMTALRSLTARPFQTPPSSSSTLFPYTTLFRSNPHNGAALTQLLLDILLSVPARFIKIERTVHSILMKRRSEEHTSELQSREKLVCRLLLEKKKQSQTTRCSRSLTIQARLTQPS